MKKMTTRALSMLLVLVLLLSSVAMVFAAQKNTGTRHQLCTSLSTQAVSYYSSNSFSYDELAAMEGNESCVAATETEIFKQLHDLMDDTMTKSVSYSSLTSYWPDTDRNNGSSDAVLFYSDFVYGNYNREHVWPKSRASFLKQNGGCDLHHLRPTDYDVNSDRGNYTMGNVRELCSGYESIQNEVSGETVLWRKSNFSQNNKTIGLVEVNDNIKGDVARIFLYVYVRWEEPNLFENISNPKLDSSDDENNGLKVIYDLETLLEWCEMDPVDTWEMSRNDACQSVQGNRNVFIDYPELAWVLFGQEVPTDMETPSGEAKDGYVPCAHEDKSETITKDPTCTENGSLTVTCNDCGKTVETKTIDALGHNNADTVIAPTCIARGYTLHGCTRCGAGTKDSYTAALGHDYQDVVVAPTCTAKGYTSRECSRCDSSYKNKFTDMLGHSYVGVTENGVTTYTCSNCSDSYTEGEAVHECPSLRFSDLTGTEWFHEYTDYAIENGLMSGFTDGTFQPNGTLTRAMVVRVLYSLDGAPEAEGENKFSDVPETWYTDAVIWASANGITAGYEDGTFRPEQKITRQEMAAMLARYAAYVGMDMTTSGSLGAYPDAQDVASWAAPSLIWCVENSIISGDKNGDVTRLNPENDATRAQFATIITRFARLQEQ